MVCGLTISHLQELYSPVGEHNKQIGLNINIKKTKFMIISRISQAFQNSNLTLNAKPIERVNLGTWLFEDWASNKKVKCQVEQTR